MKINQELEKVELPSKEVGDAMDIVEVIVLFWGVIKLVLTLVKVFTNDEGDKKIDHFIALITSKLPNHNGL